MKFVKDREWLFNNLNDNNVILVDCRFSLADPQKGKKEYLESHIPGAFYFDLEKDLSAPVKEHGGRHPLPDLEKLIRKLENAGINECKVVIAYDHGEGAYAARFWWLLKYLGHKNVYVLNGGYKQWQEANYPVTANLPASKTVKFHVELNPDVIATTKEVEEVVRHRPKDCILIDSREEKRYLGLEEPIDKKAGHIPGALNKPWMAGLHANQYKTVEEQRQRFSNIDSKNQIIVYCGSGVTAAPNFLALKEAGYEKVKLYVGSYSDWISYTGNKIE
ncbi:sulfurtransferase [Neobacillus rhizosphaerae]|uniref:sulfurtransferase n=1 Tax=Neobacillus rhizosphaerae TaxID=2880965 RepID=UPI003D2B9147